MATVVARSVVCVSVCMLDTQVICAKTAEPIEMLFERLTYVGLRNRIKWVSRSLTERGNFWDYPIH